MTSVFNLMQLARRHWIWAIVALILALMVVSTILFVLGSSSSH